MKRLFSLLLVFLMLAGCAPADSGSALQVYRAVSSEYRTHGQLIRAESVSKIDGESELDAILRALSADSSDERIYNPLSGLEILDCTVKNGHAVIELSDGYQQLDGLDTTLVNACCTMSLCALSSIDRVSVSCKGIISAAALTPSDMYLDAEERRIQRTVCLYYADENGEKLVPVYRTISTDSAERYVVQQLLLSPEGLSSPLPSGTELLGVTRKGRSCTLNLSSEFLENRPDSATGELIALYSLVNSLAATGSISEVSITVEGESVDRYVNLSLASPLTPLNFIPTDEFPQSYVSAKLYFSHENLLLGIPWVLDGTVDSKQLLLSRLMETGDLGIYENLFSEKDELQHISTSSGVCRITVGRSFFERRSYADASLALEALALTLLELEDVGSVMITYPDGTVPRLPDHDLSRPILSIGSHVIK